MPATGKTARFSDAEFTAIVEQSGTYKEVSAALGVSCGGTTLRAIKKRIVRLGLEIDHFRPSKVKRIAVSAQNSVARSMLRNLSDAEFAEIIPQVRSFGQLAKAIGMVSSHSEFIRNVRKRVIDLNLDITHFAYERPNKEKGVLFGRKTSSLLKRDPVKSKYTKGVMKKRLLAEGLLEDKCAHCGTGPEWIGQPMELALHCKNLDYTDMRLENLEIVCWNCRFVLTYELFSQRGKNAAVVKRENDRRRRFKEILNGG